MCSVRLMRVTPTSKGRLDLPLPIPIHTQKPSTYARTACLIKQDCTYYRFGPDANRRSIAPKQPLALLCATSLAFFSKCTSSCSFSSSNSFARRTLSFMSARCMSLRPIFASSRSELHCDRLSRVGIARRPTPGLLRCGAIAMSG